MCIRGKDGIFNSFTLYGVVKLIFMPCHASDLFVPTATMKITKEKTTGMTVCLTFSVLSALLLSLSVHPWKGGMKKTEKRRQAVKNFF